MSSGEEDYWGERHQDEARGILDFMLRHRTVAGCSIGVLSLSMGITIAAGALAGYQEIGRVGFLFDWEGPSNRFVTTLQDTHPLFRNFPTTDDAFWNSREARSSIGSVRCGYFRYQCEEDHVQGTYKGHAMELVNLATRGAARWTRCNDNPADMVFDETAGAGYHWVSARTDQKDQMLRYLKEIQERV
jgi:hypothetical protein